MANEKPAKWELSAHRLWIAMKENFHMKINMKFFNLTAITALIIFVLAGCQNPPSPEEENISVNTVLTPDPITFEDTSLHIDKLYVDEDFTNSIIAGYKGTGGVTYSSGNVKVATVDSEGNVTIHDIGTTVITAHKAQDAVYAAASNSYTLSVRLFEQVLIHAGTFQMGSPTTEKGRHKAGDISNEYRHEVKLTSGYYIGKYQITQAQYMWVMGSNPSRFNNDPEVGETQGKRPVERVSWYDAIVFANKLSVLEGLKPAYRIRINNSNSTDPDVWGTVPSSTNPTWDAVEVVAGSNGYRLPTEAQWEYACRAETETAFNNGNDDHTDGAKVGEVAFYSSNSGTNGGSSSRRTHEVGLKLPNAWGLYDMHGNVSEWCWDWYGVNYYDSSPLEDPQGPSSLSYRVYRGGNWYVAADELRSAYRTSAIAYTKFNEVGFRLVRP